MIQSKDRSGYIGASDTDMVVSNWNTKTFEKWWLEKLGIYHNDLNTEAIMCGNNYEHSILDALDIPELEKDKQIIIGRLRVNLDGNTSDCIYEVKTHKADKEFKVSKKYWRQVQVQMYASGFRKAFIVAYPLGEQEYRNFFTPIDKEKIELISIDYDEKFIEGEYLPKLKVLSDCLERGVFPCFAQGN